LFSKTPNLPSFQKLNDQVRKCGKNANKKGLWKWNEFKTFWKGFSEKKVAWTNKLKGNLIQKMHDTA